MPSHRRFAAVKGLLRSMAVALVACIPAMALVFTPGQAMAMLLQKSQQPQPTRDRSAPNSQRLETSQQGTCAVAVNGTIVKSGSDFALKDPSGTVYRLDSPEKPVHFEGKSVKVTGQLDAEARLIHVESIETITS